MNKIVFVPSSPVPAAKSQNRAGGLAYKSTPKLALAQFATTGCFNHTFYASPESQIKDVLRLCKECDDNVFVAKLAIYARNKGFMKDMPAFLLAYLAANDIALFERVFDAVIDNGKMLRNFIQIIRSGAVGRRSLGTAPKRKVKQWLTNRDARGLFLDSIGNNPSIADCIKLSHAKAPENKQALFSYLLDREYNFDQLPDIVKQFELFKKGETKEVPNVPFQMLDGLNISDEVWKSIAKNANWTTTRMNLNTFMRHGVFKDEQMVKLIADRLKNPELIKQSRAFPYQLLTAYQAVDSDPNMPRAIKNALQDAMEIAIQNIPVVEGKVFVCPDVSGSMSSPVTGHRVGSTTKTRCIDVAALVAASFLRTNPETEVIPFEGKVVNVNLNARDSIMTNALTLSKIGGGSTYCPAPLHQIIQKNKKVDLVIFVSDNESWVNGRRASYSKKFGEKGTELAELWHQIKVRNPKAKMICIDIQPGETVQALDDNSILNVAGWNDNVFNVIEQFVKNNSEDFVKTIESIEL